jgi:hypothetical protein
MARTAANRIDYHQIEPVRVGRGDGSRGWGVGRSDSGCRGVGRCGAGCGDGGRELHAVGAGGDREYPSGGCTRAEVARERSHVREPFAAETEHDRFLIERSGHTDNCALRQPHRRRRRIR